MSKINIYINICRRITKIEKKEKNQKKNCNTFLFKKSTSSIV